MAGEHRRLGLDAKALGEGRAQFGTVERGVLGLGEQRLVEADRERHQLGPVGEVLQRADGDARPLLVEDVVGDHDATVGQRLLGQPHVAVNDLLGVPAVHAEEPDGPGSRKPVTNR